jgi:hypothetical protein
VLILATGAVAFARRTCRLTIDEFSLGTLEPHAPAPNAFMRVRLIRPADVKIEGLVRADQSRCLFGRARPSERSLLNTRNKPPASRRRAPGCRSASEAIDRAGGKCPYSRDILQRNISRIRTFRRMGSGERRIRRAIVEIGWPSFTFWYSVCFYPGVPIVRRDSVERRRSSDMNAVPWKKLCVVLVITSRLFVRN